MAAAAGGRSSAATRTSRNRRSAYRFYGESRPEKKGPVFDSSVGGTPFSFTLGASQVIAGWDQGLQGMRIGGVRRLVIPPSLAYGTFRNGPIPPNATLVFEIELLDVQ